MNRYLRIEPRLVGRLLLTVALCTGCGSQFQVTWGDASGSTAADVVQVADGGFAVVGAAPAAGIADAVLFKLDPNGAEVWSRYYGGTNEDRFESVALAPGGGLVAAGFRTSALSGSPDAYLVLTAADGLETWSRTYGGANADFGYAARPVAAGGHLLAGSTGSPPATAGAPQGFLIKTDAAGNPEWTRTLGAYPGATYGRSSLSAVAEVPGAGAIACGFAFASGSPIRPIAYRFDTSGNLMWRLDLSFDGVRADCQGIEVMGDGSFVAAGTEYQGVIIDADWYPQPRVWRISSDGLELSGTSYPDPNPQTYAFVSSLASAGPAGIVLGGTVLDVDGSGAPVGSADAFSLRLTEPGAVAWRGRYGGVSDDQGHGVGMASDGGVVLAGDTSSYGAGTLNAYVVKTDSAGVTGAPPP